jgi:signal transduction histidine kinase
MLVEDNGKGFDFTSLRSDQGMGLYSIRKRVENLNGELTVDSHKDKGTTIIIDIPLV